MPVLVVGLSGVTACTADSPFNPGSDEPDDTSGSSSEPDPVATETTIGLVEGKLSEKARTRLKSKIAEVVDDWFDAAYAGEYPRTDFTAAYPGFSPGAAEQASADGALMSNAEIADSIDGVEFSRRRLRIDVLSVKRRAVGVTARFVLAQNTTGQIAQSERISGNLYLTYVTGGDTDGWQVFGYDAKRGVR